MAKFPFYKQLDAMDCGPTCIRMIAKHYGKNYSLQTLRDLCGIDREGVSLYGLSHAAETIHFKSLSVKINFEELREHVDLPCIVHWNQNHFVVAYKITNKKVYIADPAKGLVELSHEEFLKGWISTQNDGVGEGILLLLETTPEFYTAEDEEPASARKGWKFLFSYLRTYKRLITQLFLGLLVGSILQLIFPFLTQSIVDFGISNQNIHFVYLVLIAQIVLFISQSLVEVIRGWILLHISTRINIALISDFLIKLMRLPISFFDSKVIGDLMQRIQDHYKIERFLTASTISILFSFINLVVFGIVLLLYNPLICGVFFIGTIFYVLWIQLFMKRRKTLDYKRFEQLSINQSKIIQLIQGMQEIKLHNAETQKRWEWERIQAKLFKIDVQFLSLSQYQHLGSSFVNQLTNIIISFLAAKAVIDGEMTLGMMLSVQYILGQMNAPVHQFLGFVELMQDAKISLERLQEIHQKTNEENALEVSVLPIEGGDISVQNISFKYGGGADDELVLKNIQTHIPQGKVTAIVGSSGSGKTTLIKLMMKFYEPTSGEIRVGNTALQNCSTRLWREQFGSVLQDGFIFSDTIANNIAVGVENVNKEKLLHAVQVANIQDFIENLPLRYNTKIGPDGVGLSQGQTQRILIARAVYKNPAYIFFDEATNALDANNERVIMQNLNQFFKGKTVVIVAHRLSTVSNADKIIVLDKGEIIETGNHAQLVEKRGAYYTLVKNQLELGA